MNNAITNSIKNSPPYMKILPSWDFNLKILSRKDHHF